MRIHELVDKPEIYVTNEEQQLLNKLEDLTVVDTPQPREQWVTQNLLRKNLVKRYTREGQTFVVKNKN